MPVGGGVGVGGPGADHRDAGVFRNLGDGDGVAAGLRSDQRDHVFLVDQLFRYSHRCFSFVLVILDDQRDRVSLARHFEASGIVDLLRGHLSGLHRGFAHVGNAACDGSDHADADFVNLLILWRAACQRAKNEQHKGGQAEKTMK